MVHLLYLRNCSFKNSEEKLQNKKFKIISETTEQWGIQLALILDFRPNCGMNGVQKREKIEGNLLSNFRKKKCTVFGDWQFSEVDIPRTLQDRALLKGWELKEILPAFKKIKIFFNPTVFIF